jgi:transcriptional regulator with XRE-family HTH domain
MNANVIARKLGTLQEKGAMKATDVADALGIRPETVSRWNQGKAFPQPEAERALLDLEYIVDLLADLYQPNELVPSISSRRGGRMRCCRCSDPCSKECTSKADTQRHREA